MRLAAAYQNSHPLYTKIISGQKANNDYTCKPWHLLYPGAQPHIPIDGHNLGNTNTRLKEMGIIGYCSEGREGFLEDAICLSPMHWRFTGVKEIFFKLRGCKGKSLGLMRQ